MRFAGELAALGTAACFASSSNLFAAAGHRMGSRNLNRLRIVIALAFVILALRATRGEWWPSGAKPAALVALSLSGIVGFVFGDAFNFRSIVILGPGRASLLAATAPLFTTALAWPVLRQHPGPLAFLGMLLNFGGVALALTSQSRHEAAPAGRSAEGTQAMGVVSGLLGAIGQAGGTVLSKLGLLSGLDPLSATVIRVAAAVAALWALAAFQREVRHTLRYLRDGGALAFMAGGSFLGPFLGVTLALTSLHLIDAGVSASIVAVSPLLAILLAARFHAERLSGRALVGAVFSAAGVVILFYR